MKGKEVTHYTMASVNFAKFKSAGECKAMMRHCDTAERVKGEHSNPDIDKELTASNGTIKGLTYSKVCDAYDRRIAALDAREGANKRKDRVTLMGLDVPRPADLKDEDQNAWFKRVWDITSKVYGADNMLEGYIHRDEVHTYMDPTTKQEVTSREHMHMYVIPERNGRLCAKECTARASMIALNNAIQKMSEEEFGVQFMDGSQRKTRGNVETMKQASARAQIDKEIAEAQEAAEAARKAANAEEDNLRVIAAAQALYLKGGKSIYDNLLNAYETRPEAIPRIPADVDRIKAKNAARTAALEEKAEEIMTTDQQPSTTLNHPERGMER